MSAIENLPRLNGVIRAFEQGKPAFTTFTPTEAGAATALRSAPYDGVVFEMEHLPYDVRGLVDGLQYLLDRRQIATSGSLAPAVTPLARIPANGGEMNQWQAKQVLDQGVYGVLWPHINTVAEARNAVVACRYARPPGSPYFEPGGIRGDGPVRAAAYWGMTPEEYCSRADVWPLNPQGEIFVGILCETERGIKNLRSILKEVPGIAAVLIGKADLAQDLGQPRQYKHPSVAAAIDQALAICQEFKVPCGLPGVESDDVEPLLEKGFRWLMMMTPRHSHAALEKARRATGR